MRGPMDSARSRAVISFGLPSRSTVMPAWLARYFGSRSFLSAPSRWSSKMSALATRSTFSLLVERPFRVFLKVARRGEDSHFFVAGERVLGARRAAPAAADQASAQFLL